MHGQVASDRSCRPTLEELEPRLLLSADFSNVALPEVLPPADSAPVVAEPLEAPASVGRTGPRQLGEGEGVLTARWSADVNKGYLFDGNDTDVPIPDDGSWVWSSCYTTAAPPDSAVTEVEIYVKIRHTYIGDLQVDVDTDPITTTWTIHDHSGGSDDDIIGWYNNYTDFDGMDPNQVWDLWAVDDSPGDTGYIDYWEIYVYYDTSVLQDDAYEENDTRATAYDLSAHEQTWLSTISGAGVQADDDWYEIYVSPGEENLVADVAFTDSVGDIDLEVHDAGGLVTGSYSTTDDEHIDTILPGPGTYYLRVFYGDAGNTYDLWWDDLQPQVQDDTYEENDTRATAYDLSAHEQTWLSTISGPGVQADDDWYEIYVTAGDEHLIVDLTFSHAAGDIDLEVYDSGGSLVADSYSTSDDEHIDTILPGPGTYYLLVYFGNAGNTYDLWWDDTHLGPVPGDGVVTHRALLVDAYGLNDDIYGVRDALLGSTDGRWIGGNVTLIEEVDATVSNVQSGIYALVAACDQDDLALIYFTCHGFQVGFDEAPADEPDADDGELGMNDGSILDDDLGSWCSVFAAGPYPMDRFVLIVDSCYSGEVLDGTADPAGTLPSHVIMTASQADELSSGGTPYSEFTDPFIGALTTYAASADLNADGYVSAEEAFAWADPRCFGQDPEISDAFPGGLDLICYLADPIPPNDPTGLAMTARTDQTIELSWTAPTQAPDGDYADSYIVERDGVPVGWPVGPTFTDTGLAAATPYSYEVYAVDDAANRSLGAAAGAFSTTWPGDATMDGCVDGLDYVAWSNNYQQSGGWEEGDFTHNGFVDGLDYIVWSNNYEAGCPTVPSAASVASALPSADAAGGAVGEADELAGLAEVAAARPAAGIGFGPAVVDAGVAHAQLRLPSLAKAPAVHYAVLRPAAAAAPATEAGVAPSANMPARPTGSLAGWPADLEGDLVDVLGLALLKAPLQTGR